MKKESNMSNVIQFLESMGQNPALNRLSPADYAAVVAALDVDCAQRQALLARDHVALNDLLEGQKQMMCVLLPADDDEKQQESEPGRDQDPTPDEDESITSSGRH